MTTIRPATEIGTVLTGRSEAAVLRRQIEQLVRHGDTVTVDFDGVISASPSFADELFAKLDSTLVEHHEVLFANVPASLAAIAKFVRAGRASSVGS